MPDLPISGLQEKTTGFDPSDLLVIEDGTATKKVQIGVLFVAASSVPNVSSVSPNLLQNTGNQTITVTGSGFSSSDIISVSGATVVSSNFIDENTIEIVIDTDSTAGGTYTVTVTNSTNGGQGSGTFDVLGYVTEDIEFTSFSLTDTVTINGKDNNLRKPSSSGNGWTGDARSMKGITQGNGKIEFTLISGGVYRMIGLSENPDSSASWQNLKFALYVAGNNMNVYSSGGYQGSAGSFSGTNRFSIEIVGNGDVVFSNVTTNTVLFTMTNQTVNYPIYFDCSIYSGSDTFIIEDCTITGILG